MDKKLVLTQELDNWLGKILKFKEFLSKPMYTVTPIIGMEKKRITSIIVKRVRQSGYVKIVVYYVIKIMI